VPLYEGDVSGYTQARSYGLARLLVEIGAPDSKSGRRPTRATTDDGEMVTGTLGRLASEWEHPERARDRLRTATGDESAADIGKQLFAALFSGPLSRCWAKSAEQARKAGGLELIVYSDDIVVHGLAWELLYDPVVMSGHVALLDGWSIIRRRSTPGPPPTPPRAGRWGGDLQVLVVTSATSGVSVDNDPAIISDTFGKSHIEIVNAPNSATLLSALAAAPRHLVHVLATGERARGRQQLQVGDPSARDMVSGKDILRALASPTTTTPDLLVLAACDTDLLAAELAVSLPNVVAMRGKISDAGCLAFLRGLYAALASGSPAGQAVAAGRAQQLGFSQSLGDEWALPVAFLADNGGPLVNNLDLATNTNVFSLQPMPATASSNVDEPNRVLLDMKQANLASLKQQWEPVKTSVPQFVRQQIETLEREVDELAKNQRPTR
jgi:hypothetical protein